MTLISSMRRPGNDTRFADTIDSIEEKISLFEKYDTALVI